MNKKGIVIGILLAVALGAGFLYRFTHLNSGGGEHTEKQEAGQKAEQADGHDKEHEGHKELGSVKMAVEVQKQYGVVVVPAQKQGLGGNISATGKVEANADRIAHVSPIISGKIVEVTASLGDSISAGQILATLDSVELGEALNRYHQSKTKLVLAQSNMERIKTLVEKKIAARKDIFQAENDFKTAQTELHTDEARLSLFGVSVSDLKKEKQQRLLLPIQAPIGGIITEKHAIVGELSDPAKSIYTIADLSSVWVLTDINEKDLARVKKGQTSTVKVGAFPDRSFDGRITYIADLVDEATRTVKARVEVQNPDRVLKPEMFATVELALPATTPPVLAVPEEALQELEGKKVLFVAESESTFEPRTVELGQRSGGMVEIVDGLEEGELYAVKGSFLLKSELMKGELGEHGH